MFCLHLIAPFSSYALAPVPVLILTARFGLYLLVLVSSALLLRTSFSHNDVCSPPTDYDSPASSGHTSNIVCIACMCLCSACAWPGRRSEREVGAQGARARGGEGLGGRGLKYIICRYSKHVRVGYLCTYLENLGTKKLVS